jgi:hypothetical protein
MATILDLCRLHPFAAALLVSVVGGIPVTLAWSQAFHWILRKTYADHRRVWIGVTFGLLERTLLTTFVLWLPMAVGPFAGTWIVAKGIIGWGDLDSKTEDGRARYAVTLMGSLVSILWAIGWGIWGNPPQVK